MIELFYDDCVEVKISTLNSLMENYEVWPPQCQVRVISIFLDSLSTSLNLLRECLQKHFLKFMKMVFLLFLVLGGFVYEGEVFS